MLLLYSFHFFVLFVYNGLVVYVLDEITIVFWILVHHVLWLDLASFLQLHLKFMDSGLEIYSLGVAEGLIADRLETTEDNLLLWNLILLLSTQFQGLLKIILYVCTTNFAFFNGLQKGCIFRRFILLQSTYSQRRLKFIIFIFRLQVSFQSTIDFNLIFELFLQACHHELVVI